MFSWIKQFINDFFGPEHPDSSQQQPKSPIPRPISPTPKAIQEHDPDAVPIGLPDPAEAYGNYIVSEVFRTGAGMTGRILPNGDLWIQRMDGVGGAKIIPKFRVDGAR